MTAWGKATMFDSEVFASEAISLESIYNTITGLFIPWEGVWIHNL